MNVYAEMFAHTLQTNFTALRFRDYLPRAMRWPRGLEGVGIRLSRFISYPAQARVYREDAAHILEPGYAHIMRSLDPSRTIVTVHDIIPILGWYGSVPGLKYPRRPRLNEYSFGYLRHARFLMTVSEATKRDLVRFLGCDPDRIVVALNGLFPEFQPMSPPARMQARAHLGLPGSPTRLVLITGHQGYKNQETSAKVFQRAVRDDKHNLKLVRLGRQTPEWRRIVETLGIEDSVIELPYLPEKDVVALYNAVDVLLFPSWYEGFGWPALQAMACGTPVIASNAGALPEVVGDSGCTRNPADADGLCQDLQSILRDADLVAELRTKGLARAKTFTWYRHVESAVNLYREILSGQKPHPMQAAVEPRSRITMEGGL